MDPNQPQNQMVKLCSATNEVEASLIVQMLAEEGIVARTDGSPGSSVFGGLPFESGHHLFVIPSQLDNARQILSKHPHFQGLDQPEES